MDVRRDRGVRVDNQSVPVKMPRPSWSLLGGEPDRSEPEADQHRRDGKLEGIRHPGRQFGSHEDERGADDQKGERMANAPPRAKQCGAEAAALPADERCHRRQVVGLEGMAHPQQRSEPGPCQDLDQRHLLVGSILYVIPRRGYSYGVIKKIKCAFI